MSQQLLANELEISQSSLSSIENGETDKIDFIMIDKICKIFEVTHDYFSNNHQNNTYHIQENKGNISTNHYGNVYQCPDELINAIKMMIENFQRK